MTKKKKFQLYCRQATCIVQTAPRPALLVFISTIYFPSGVMKTRITMGQCNFLNFEGLFTISGPLKWPFPFCELINGLAKAENFLTKYQ